jgi:ATP-dependent RNA helicase RhlE
MSSQSFADLGVSKAVVTALAKSGITTPFKIQNAVIGDALAGRDILARSPTGSGKTLGFGIPLADRIQAEARRPSALVLAPTRELATQIVDEIRGIAHARALKVCAVYGGVGLIKQAQQAANAHIIVATPGRLEDQLARGAFTLDNVKMLVIDEADRMLDMGFRPAIDRIVELCPADRQTLFFSATLEGEAGRVAKSYTRSAAFHEHGPAERRASEAVDHQFVEVTHETRIEALLDHLRSERDLSLVFVRTKHGADKLVKKLSNHGVAAVAMHGNKTQRQRERALAQFESYEVDTLIATDVAARGIDVNGISHVINFDPPHDSETYVHRVGRTGRAGATGVAVALVSRDQRKDMARMVGELGIKMGLSQSVAVGAAGFSREKSSSVETGTGSTRRERHGDAGFERDGGSRHGRKNDRDDRSGRGERSGRASRSGKRDGGRSHAKPARDGFSPRGKSRAPHDDRRNGHGDGHPERGDGHNGNRGTRGSGSSWKGDKNGYGSRAYGEKSSGGANAKSGGRGGKSYGDDAPRGGRGAKARKGSSANGKSYEGRSFNSGKTSGKSFDGAGKKSKHGKAGKPARPGRPGNRASRAARAS